MNTETKKKYKKEAKEKMGQKITEDKSPMKTKAS
jgi:hypothetical protein